MEFARTSCGPLYKAGLDSFTSGEPAAVRLFAGGFVTGQAEKVYLGACRAAMFRPSGEHVMMLLRVVEEVARRYGLLIMVMRDPDEIWICRDSESLFQLTKLCNMRRNTAEWHAMRAKLCGVPDGEVDTNFHERIGAADRCD